MGQNKEKDSVQEETEEKMIFMQPEKTHGECSVTKVYLKTVEST